MSLHILIYIELEDYIIANTINQAYEYVLFGKHQKFLPYLAFPTSFAINEKASLPWLTSNWL